MKPPIQKEDHRARKKAWFSVLGNGSDITEGGQIWGIEAVGAPQTKFVACNLLVVLHLLALTKPTCAGPEKHSAASPTNDIMVTYLTSKKPYHLFRP